MRVFTTFEDVAEAAGQALGVSAWATIDQARVDAFADATDDHQWIHVDVNRAKQGRSVAPSRTVSSPSRWLRG